MDVPPNSMAQATEFVSAGETALLLALLIKSKDGLDQMFLWPPPRIDGRGMTMRQSRTEAVGLIDVKLHLDDPARQKDLLSHQ